MLTVTANPIHEAMDRFEQEAELLGLTPGEILREKLNLLTLGTQAAREALLAEYGRQ